MPRKCSLCIHDRRQEIEQALLCGDSYRTIAQRFTVSRDAVVRHRKHLPAALAHARELKEVAHGDSLLAQLRELTLEAQRLKVKAERAGDYRTALAAVRELCRIVELLAKMLGISLYPHITCSGKLIRMDSTRPCRAKELPLLQPGSPW